MYGCGKAFPDSVTFELPTTRHLQTTLRRCCCHRKGCERSEHSPLHDPQCSRCSLHRAWIRNGRKHAITHVAVRAKQTVNMEKKIDVQPPPAAESKPAPGPCRSMQHPRVSEACAWASPLLRGSADAPRFNSRGKKRLRLPSCFVHARGKRSSPLEHFVHV